ISSATGKYNIGNVGIFVWRLKSVRVDRAPAIPSVADGPACFRFSQLGADSQLFNHTPTVSGRVVESGMPGPLRVRALYDELEAARAALSPGESPVWRYRGDDPVVATCRDGVQVPRENIQICDLGDWSTPPTAESVPLPGGPLPLTCVVSVDPALGRLIFL